MRLSADILQPAPGPHPPGISQIGLVGVARFRFVGPLM